MAVHQLPQDVWRQHLDVIAPHVEVPGHLEMTGGPEADDQRAIGLIGDLLRGMELEAAGVRGSGRREAPDHLAKLLGVLEHAERAVRELLQVSLVRHRD